MDLFFLCSFLLHGHSYRRLANRFRISPAKVHQAVKETCQATEIAPPTKENWIHIKKEFYKHWNFPNCLGVLDGKHVVIQAPGNSVGIFRSYKRTFSINFMALVDASYRFIFMDVGQLGSNADGAVFRSSFGQAFLNG